MPNINYQVEKSDITLPSKGLLYSEKHPLHNGVVTIHHMTAREEDILSSRTLLKKGQALNELLRSSIEGITIDPLDILSCDRNALFIAIRISGFGAEYPIQTICSKCEKTSNHTIDLSKLNYREPTIQSLQLHTNLFEYTLPKSKLNVKFKLMTGHDEQIISQLQDKITSTINIVNEKEVTLRMKQMIVSIDDETNPSILSEIIGSLPVMDTRAFRKFVDEVEPGIDMKHTVMCSYCDYEEEVGVPITSDFFWPAL